MAICQRTGVRFSNWGFSLGLMMICSALVCAPVFAGPSDTSTRTVITASDAASQVEPPESAANVDLTVFLVRLIDDAADIATGQMEAALSEGGMAAVRELLASMGELETVARIETSCVLSERNAIEIRREIPYAMLSDSGEGEPIPRMQAMAAGLEIRFHAPNRWDRALDLEYQIENSASPGATPRDVQIGVRTQQIDVIERSTMQAEGTFRLEAPDTVHIQRFQGEVLGEPCETIVIWRFDDLW